MKALRASCCPRVLAIGLLTATRRAGIAGATAAGRSPRTGSRASRWPRPPPGGPADPGGAGRAGARAGLHLRRDRGRVVPGDPASRSASCSRGSTSWRGSPS